MNPSLLLIPDRYKAAKLYSQIPDSGAGDLTFARNSNATRVNSAGLIEKVRTNVDLQSETFDTASWFKPDATITANVGVAPNGTTTADKIVPTTTGTNRWVEQSRAITASIPYTNSFFVKADGFSWAAIHHIDGSVGAWFNVSSGTIGTITAGNTALITSVGNGWYRCSVAKISGGATGYSVLQLADADNSLTATASGTNGLLIWGAQTETGDIATDYIPTTTAAVSVGITADIPRLDYTGGGCPSLLLEPQRTNLLTSSEDFNSWTLIGGGSVTSNTSVSPDGFANADTIEPLGYARRIITMAGGSNTFSIYLKAKDTNCVVRIGFLGVGDISLIDTQETITTSQWKRMTITYTNAIAPLGVYFNIQSGDNDVFVWGAQLEAGSYVSSYIPTLGSSVTRLADAASKTGISSLIGQSEGVLYAEVDINVKEEAGTPVVGIFALNVNAANGDNAIFIGINRGATNQIYGVVNSSGVNQVIILSGNISSGLHKVALAYKANDFALFVDGVLVDSDVSGSVPATSQVLLSQRFNGDTVSLNDRLRDAAIYTTRLSNSELATLTSL